MHQLGLEVHDKSEFKAKMADNVSVKCVGVCRRVKITVCAIKVTIDMYVIPAKGEGYLIILGKAMVDCYEHHTGLGKGHLNSQTTRTEARRSNSV